MNSENVTPVPPVPLNPAPAQTSSTETEPADAAPPRPARTPAKGLRFEWLGDQYYRVGLHYGENFLLIGREDMERLSEAKNADPKLFLDRIIETAGDNRYLKSALMAAAAEGDSKTLAAAFQDMKKSHRG